MAVTAAEARKFLPKSTLNARKDVSSSKPGPSDPFTRLPIEASMFSVTRCTQCVAPLPEHYPYKWCESCRAKDRDKAKRKRERKQARVVHEHNGDHIRSRPTEVLDRAEGSSSHAGSRSSTAAVPQKRKVDAVDAPVKAPSPVRPRIVAGRKRFEFQTQDRLLDALAARVQALQRESEEANTSSTSTSSCLNFWGGYTIVLDPDIPLKERVEMVESELKNRTALPLGLVIKRVDGCTATGYIQRHWCTCMGIAPPPKATPVPIISTPPPLQGAAPVKRNGSMLMNWLAGGNKSKSGERAVDGGLQDDPSARPGRGVCGGTISIDAVVDSSHPLAEKGVKGQRVTVQVEHPGRYV
ncbi:hypothetical protein C8Q73DRAFT_793779 [Cubamyces lactineus]|nr:hypothetical protein C8Q73DRAFT_793779 [Cubamyces lactineus]